MNGFVAGLCELRAEGKIGQVIQFVLKWSLFQWKIVLKSGHFNRNSQYTNRTEPQVDPRGGTHDSTLRLINREQR